MLLRDIMTGLCQSVIFPVLSFPCVFSGFFFYIQLWHVEHCKLPQPSILGRARYVQEISANAHETRDSIGWISYAGCLGLSPLISAAFTLQMCVAAQNHEKFTKTGNPYFRGSRSFKVVDVGTLGMLVSSACYDKKQVCVYVQPFSW